ITRISPEAPVPILGVTRRRRTLGGAGNVVKNLRSLGIRVSAIVVTGKDSTGRAIARELDRIGADAEVIQEIPRISTRKTRLMSIEHGRQVFRYDQETEQSISAKTESEVMERLRGLAGAAQAVMCSDYLKGALTVPVLRAAIEAGSTCSIPVVMSPKGSDASRYRGAEVLIHNQRELELLSRVPIRGEQSLGVAARTALEAVEARSLLVTRGAKGMSLFHKSGTAVIESHIPTVARSVYDVTGAGDTAASVFTASIAAGANHKLAATIANLAAGIVVGKRGTSSTTPEEILGRAREDLSSEAAPAAFDFAAG
ncbi:MAG: PfkB family carbohydrate kinase, partial [Bryobacteraceae bacterium]